MNYFRLGIALFSLFSLSAGDWPQFRGIQGNGVSFDTQVPTKLNRDSILWSTDLPGRGVSSPIIMGDHVFVTCTSGTKNERLRVLSYKTSDGSLRWERQFWATGRTMTHEKISGATPTPVTDGQRVYALFSSNDCFALDLDGNLVWFRGLGRDYPNANNSLGMASSLVLVQGILVAQIESQSESFTVGLDATKGHNLWKIDRPKISNWTSPVLLRGREGLPSMVLLQTAKGLTAVNPQNGSIVWEHEDKAGVVPSSVVHDGIIYLPAQGLVALDPSQTSGPKVLWRSPQLRVGTPSPIVSQGRVYVLNDGGILSCGDIQDGKRLWQVRLKGAFSATPVLAGGCLYSVNEQGLVQVIDLKSGEGPVLSEMELGQAVIATPAIADNSLFVRSDGKLWRIGRNSSL